MFELSSTPLFPCNQYDTIIYFIRPTLRAIKLVATQIQAQSTNRVDSSRTRKHYLFMVPRRTLLCERSLAHLGVYGDVSCSELAVDLFPHDDDVLSLCLTRCFRELSVSGNPTSLYDLARVLLRMQSMFGHACRFLGKGQHAHRIAKLMQRMRKERDSIGNDDTERSDDSSLLKGIVLIDRSVDLVTPMLHQLTYEGAIDEILGIHNGYVEVDASIVGGVKARAGATTKIALNSNDTLFKEIRDINFTVLGPRLKSKAAAVQEIYEERHSADTISAMGKFMKKFKNVQKLHTSLQTHISLADQLSQTMRSPSFHRLIRVEHSLLDGNADDVEDVLEEMIGRRECLTGVLRLFCLMSLIRNGVKDRTYDHLRREIVQSYGYEHLFTLENLVKAGLLKRRISRSSWPTLCKGLRLVCQQDSINLDKPQDFHFTFQRYAPLSARLVEAAFTMNGWKEIEDLMAVIPGKSFDFFHQNPNSKKSSTAIDETKKRSVLVVFIGGVTLAEIAALRFLSERSDENNYVVVTTNITTGSSMIQELIDQIDNGLERMSSNT